MSEQVSGSGWVYSAVNIVAHGAMCVLWPPCAPQVQPVFDIKGYGSRLTVIVMIIPDLEVWVWEATSTRHPAVSCFLAQNCCGQFFIIMHVSLSGHFLCLFRWVSYCCVCSVSEKKSDKFCVINERDLEIKMSCFHVL